MKRFLSIVALLIICTSAKTQEIWIKDNNYIPVEIGDTGVFYVNPYSTAFFDNKEYTSNIKKGYTHPGFFIQPKVSYKLSSKTSIHAGFHMLYFAGTDSLEKLIPVLTLQVELFEGTEMLLGSIHSKQLHFLPEPLFKPERLFTAQPEIGMQFLTNTNTFKADSWTNWERYIKPGSKFQEVFTMGLSTIYRPNGFENRKGLTLNAFGFGVHNGGQIDSTNLQVTTMINLGGGFSYTLPILSGKTLLGFELMGFISTDKSPNPQSKYLNGNAIYPKVYVEYLSFRGELGYWRANKFTNPRGEELFGSYSTVNPTFDSDIRNLYTAKLIYNTEITKGFVLGGRFETYYDPEQSVFDWAFTFKMVFDRNILIKR